MKAAKIAGIIATTTTVSRAGLRTDIQQEGGLSGAPLFERSTAMIRQIHEATDGEIPIIGVGGIRSGDDAVQYLLAGASLVALGTASFADPRAALRVLNGLERFGAFRRHGQEQFVIFAVV